MIQLVGPGGAGKTTTGIALAKQLDVEFVDLDMAFMGRYGDISAYINKYGYNVYAAQNVSLYLDVIGTLQALDVIALSSGFMTYQDDIHPDYLYCGQRIALSALSFVLLPSLDLETCVAETVRRQLQRPFSRTAAREQNVIRTRFSPYLNLPPQKVETMRPMHTVITEILGLLPKAN